MFNTDILYRKDSNPLELVADVELNEVYFTDEGYGIKFLNHDELVIMNSSPLVFGEYMHNLTSKQVKLFWTLVKNTSPIIK